MGKKDKDSEHTEDGVLDLIEKYLSEERDVKSYDEQIAVVVYYLLGGTQFDDYIGYYPTASASVLRAFASSDVGDKLKREAGTFNFDTLCKDAGKDGRILLKYKRQSNVFGATGSINVRYKRRSLAR